MSDGWDEIMAGADPRVRDLAVRTRALIREEMPDVVEVPWPRQRTIGYGVGPRKMAEHYRYIAVHPNHVNLGFYYGAELSDPAGLLGGPGKLLRHMKVRTAEDLENAALRRLLEQASTHRMPARPTA